MPTHVLEGDRPVGLPAKPVTVRISGASGVELSALVDGRPDPRALRPVGEKLILPVVDQPTVIRATPVGGGTFGSSTVITCTAEIEIRGEHDPERAVLAQVDLSGLTGRDLIQINPAGSRLELISQGVVTNTNLPELASTARDLAREALGAERAEASRRQDLTVVVDCSASMRPLMEEGSLTAALEVLTGVSQVTSNNITIRLAGVRSLELPEVPLAELGRATSDAALTQPLAGSVRLDPAATGRTCIVSDNVVSSDQVSTGGAGAHWLLLVPASSWQVLRHRGQSVSAALVPEWGQGRLDESLLQDRQMLGALTHSLVTGLLGEMA